MKSFKLSALLLVAVLSLSGCDLLGIGGAPDGGPPGPGPIDTSLPAVNLGDEFDLAYGGSVQVPSANIRYLTFSAVLEDSRCPIDVMCPWAGNAKLELEIHEMGNVPIKFELNTTSDPRELFFGEFRVDLVNVLPKPVSNSEIPYPDYVITLKVEDVEEQSGF